MSLTSLCEQCNRATGELDFGFRSNFVPSPLPRNSTAVMKLEYPCRVEGWLNVCGKWILKKFLFLIRVGLYFVDDAVSSVA